MTNKKISNTISLVFSIESGLVKSIQSKQISKEIIESFDLLSKNLFGLANQFYKKFNKDFISQLITFGALSMAANICINLKDNLEAAKARGENPIAANKVLNNNYLLYLNALLGEIGTIQEGNPISDNSFLVINESVKNLVSLAKKDNIYGESAIKFATKDGEKTFIEVLNNTAFMF